MSAKSSERYMNDAANWLQSHTRTRTHTTLLALVSPFICIWIGRLIGSKYIYTEEAAAREWIFDLRTQRLSQCLSRCAIPKKVWAHALRQRYNYSSEIEIPWNQRFSRHDCPFIIRFCLCAFDCKSLRQSNSATATRTQSRVSTWITNAIEQPDNDNEKEFLWSDTSKHRFFHSAAFVQIPIN